MASVHAGHGEQFKRPMLPMDLVPAKRGRFEGGGAGQALVVAGGPQQNQVPRLSNLQAPIMLCNGHEGEIYTARFSLDGSCFASAGFDMRGHSGAVMDINFNTDASIIVSASTDKTVRVWDMQTGACQRRFKSHSDIVNAVHPARRGPQLICSASDDGCAKVHDIRMKDAVKTYENKYQQTAVTFNDTSDQVWDMRKDEVAYVLRGHGDTITGISLSPDGNYVLSNSMDCSVRTWDVRPFTPADRKGKTYFGHQHNFEKNLLKCGWSPDGSRITAGSSDRFAYVWEVGSKKILYKLPGHQGSVNATDFHPKEPILLSAGSDKRIYLGEIM
ncbi:hypothetical protein WR25_07136 [Diploscapter pachys]|uniref:Uncharacterized protein n=1 Tax=Diploscapter pachys TaxID=2018661 RepID=A0A2A2JF52_9BILA|nr:hypothetical protein WR25_07136 [Diploscapter pachys]